MSWSDVTKGNYAETVRLLGRIDSGESYMFEKCFNDSEFGGWITKRYFKTEHNITGVLIAYIYDGSLHIGISFEPDMPNCAEAEIMELLRDIKDGRIWCCAENKNLVDRLTKSLSTKPGYSAREMSVSKACFSTWETPEIQTGFQFRDYDPVDHEEYINLLEEALSHVSIKGTFVNQSDSLKEAWSDSSERNLFISLWDDGNLIGMCHSHGLEIIHLAVSEAYRSRGFGYTLLYNSIKHIYQQRNEGLLCLYVVDSNEHAYRFYLRAGMGVTGHAVRFAVNS